MNILITGASSGIGFELALFYAKKATNLFLCARNFNKLQELKEKCKDFPAKIHIFQLDVRDFQACSDLIQEIERDFAENSGIDLIIANAGVSGGTLGGVENFTQIKTIFDTNLYGVLNIITPAIDFMKKRQKGQIAIISSLAGFRGLPSSPSYSASKAAVRLYGEALRGNLHQFNIKVNVICPGYVKSPMTAVNKFYMPFLMETEKAVKIIAKGIAKNKSRLAFPLAFYFFVYLVTILPTALTDGLMRILPKKE